MIRHFKNPIGVALYASKKTMLATQNLITTEVFYGGGPIGSTYASRHYKIELTGEITAQLKTVPGRLTTGGIS
ncbi:MAG: hypothetical protein ACJAZ0_002052 [Halioglobus sp.]|jgi:hypothetical protein